MTALVRELTPAPSLPTALLSFQGWPGLVCFDSARRDRHGRYSFLSADPVWSGQIPLALHGHDPFRDVRIQLEQLSWQRVPGLPPFQGGVAGLLSYELGGCWERLPSGGHLAALPCAWFGVYDWVLAWDHLQDRAWVIVQPTAQAQRRLDRVLKQVATVPVAIPREAGKSSAVNSNFTPEAYQGAVQRVIDYIYAGDIFQANLSQQLSVATEEKPLEVYLRLRECNPAPFGGYLQGEHWAVLSSSPERFLELQSNIIKTRPIKGTRLRPPNPQLDLLRQDELRESAKDQAENVMIVDLLRNDLSRVCQPGTIRVPELCTLETYATVSHLVSEVQGTLRPGTTFWDALQATFPGGSITGAPKIRAMEIISELEQVARGPYCGSLFYLTPDGVADSNILIRTMTWQPGLLTFPVGGGITARSEPVAEWEETVHKAQGMLRVFR